MGIVALPLATWSFSSYSGEKGDTCKIYVRDNRGGADHNSRFLANKLMAGTGEASWARELEKQKLVIMNWQVGVGEINGGGWGHS